MDYSLFMLLWRHLKTLKLRAYLELCNLFTFVTDIMGCTQGLKIVLGNDLVPLSVKSTFPIQIKSHPRAP